MKIIDFNTISALGIHPSQCVEWVKEAFLTKQEATLPPKNSITLPGNIFLNTMPCMLNGSPRRFAVKEATRYPGRNPSVNCELFLYDGDSGEMLAVMDGNWITAMRTGAVAALAINTFRHSHSKTYAFTGLGNMARSTMLCLCETYPEEQFHVKLMAYKDQHTAFIERFSGYPNVSFEVVDNNRDLICDSDVIVSCVTAADSHLGEDEWYKDGVTVIPVHTRGFQNCDLFFDKIFCDDKGHVKGFKYFDRFRSLDEFGEVLSGNAAGRTTGKERILSYNIGIALHDVFFASKIYDMVNTEVPQFKLNDIKDKFYI